MIRIELERRRDGKGKLRPYAGTKEAELFAVALEAFCEKPEMLKRHHPELYEYFLKYFGRLSPIESILSPIVGIIRESLMRNKSCPCGSGKKYKKCCLLKSAPAQP